MRDRLQVPRLTDIRKVGEIGTRMLRDVIRLFEDLGAGAPAAPEGRTPVDRALGQVLAEIDQIAQATFGSITVATMLGMVDRAATPAP